MKDINNWINRSIEIANGIGYYDQLIRVYPINDNELREIKNENAIKNAYNEKNQMKLFDLLLEQDKFPIDDPYVAAFRRGFKPSKNPETIKRIMERVLCFSLNEILSMIQEPAKPSRQIGQLFHNWINNIGIPVLKTSDFLENRNIAILEGNDTSLKKFAEQYLEYHIDKGLDLVARVDDTFIIGEAKFLTDLGGTQNNQFKSALNLVQNYNGNAIPIAILDGICWLENKTMLKNIKEVNGNIMSALLLVEFLRSLL